MTPSRDGGDPNPAQPPPFPLAPPNAPPGAFPPPSAYPPPAAYPPASYPPTAGGLRGGPSYPQPGAGPLLPHVNYPPAQLPDQGTDGGLGRAAVFAVGAAVVAAIAWYAIVAATNYQIAYLALLFGFGVGTAAVRGHGRPHASVAALSVGVTLVAIVVAEYFIARHLAIRGLAEYGENSSLPLWLGSSTAVELIKVDLRENPMTVLFWILGCFGAARASLKG